MYQNFGLWERYAVTKDVHSIKSANLSIPSGIAHRTSEKLTALPGAAPIIIRPPEVVVYDDSEGRAGSAWSKSADIWAVGCTVRGN